MKIQIPNTTKDITVEQYAKWNMVADDSDKEFVGHKLLSIFLNISMKEALSMRQDEAQEVTKDILDALDATPEMEYTFMHEGIEYGFIPDFQKLTLGEYVDLENYIGKAKEWHKAMAVLFRPVTQKIGELYDIEPYIGDSNSHDVAKTFPASHFINCTVFFYNLSKLLLVNSAFYLGKLLKSKEMENLKTLVSKDSLVKDGAGLTLSTSLVKEMQQNLNKLLK